MRSPRQTCVGSLKVASLTPSYCLDQHLKTFSLSMPPSQVRRSLCCHLECFKWIVLSVQVATEVNHDLFFLIHQEHNPSLPSFLWVTTSAAGTTMTRRMYRQWMQALMSMTSLMTISGSTLSTRMESAISPGIHTSFPHQRKCCRASRIRSARYKRAKPAFSQTFYFCSCIPLPHLQLKVMLK